MEVLVGELDVNGSEVELSSQSYCSNNVPSQNTCIIASFVGIFVIAVWDKSWLRVNLDVTGHLLVNLGLSDFLFAISLLVNNTFNFIL